MFSRLMVVLVSTVFVSGCAMSGAKPQPITQVQTQVTDLQQRMEEQEKEIVDIKYEVKELASKVETRQVIEVEESVPTPKTPSVAVTGTHADLLKVNVSGEDLQRALKGAGVYDGNIDGKIGPRTKNAIIEFQRQHGLKADGVVGQKTWGELKQYMTE